MNTLLAAAQLGFDQPIAANPYPEDERRHRAWAAGVWLAQTGRSRPWHCASLRGKRLAINDMTLAQGEEGFTRES